MYGNYITFYNSCNNFLSGQITADESIFTYASGQNVDTFSDPNHEPPFLDEIRANLEGNNTLFQVCGDNLQCLFDVGQTGDENVGMDTLQFEEQVEEQVIMSGMIYSDYYLVNLYI